MAQSDETFKGIALASRIAVKIAPDVFPSRYRQHHKILPDSTHLPMVRGSLSRPDPVQVSVKFLLGRSNYARIVNSRPSSAGSSWHEKVSGNFTLITLLRNSPAVAARSWPPICIWAVGRKRPPLCRGCAPATPPSKTMPHPPCAFIAACRLASTTASVNQLRS